MLYKFEFRPYKRRFKRPLKTSRGIWDVREGIILRLTAERDKFGLGEIAPLSWFGSETLLAALDFCRQLPAQIAEETIFSIPDELPACKFGFESAWESIEDPPKSPLKRGTSGVPPFSMKTETPGVPPFSIKTETPGVPPFSIKTETPGVPSFSIKTEIPPFSIKTETPEVPPFSIKTETPEVPPFPRGVRGDLNLTPVSFSALLPAGELALETWQQLWHRGYRTFKWKIAVSSIEEELKLLENLLEALPTGVILRLDANGGLSWETANRWLEVCDRFPEIIEFLEQPLPTDCFEEMLKLGDRHSTPIALDESVANLGQMQECYRRGWRGIFVVKPSIFGGRSQLRDFLLNHPVDVVFSSVFETEIGRQAVLELAAELQTILPKNRPLGFGIDGWLEE